MLGTEVKYWDMTHTICELLCLNNLLTEFDFQQKSPMSMHSNTQSAIYIAKNFVFYDHTKHIELDCQLVRDYCENSDLYSSTPSSEQLLDILSKTISTKVFSILYVQYCVTS